MTISFLAIAGSERPNGNTDQALEFARNLIENLGGELEVVELRDLNITPCGTCSSCQTKNCNLRATPCEHIDDTFSIYKKMEASDCIIYATPVYGFGMPNRMQNFIERVGVGYLRFERPLTNKIGGVIVVSRRYSHDSVFNQLIKNISLNRMFFVGSGFPVFLSGGSPGEIFSDKEGVDSLQRMIIRMYQMAVWMKRSEKILGEPFPSPGFGNERSYITA